MGASQRAATAIVWKHYRKLTSYGLDSCARLRVRVRPVYNPQISCARAVTRRLWSCQSAPVHRLHSSTGKSSHTWEECRRCGGLAVAEARTCKRALRWRPAVGQTAATIPVACSGRSLTNFCCLSLLSVFRAPTSGNRNACGFRANYPACTFFPNETNVWHRFAGALRHVDNRRMEN
jgi:hypothetical protein